MEAFTAPKTGNYKLECWGAQGGGYSSYPGGRGAYTKGDLTLTQGENLYVCVGQNGSADGIIFNNGSERTYHANGNGTNYPGGGATDIRLETGSSWKDFASLKTRIMVAASGGGSNMYFYANSGRPAGSLNGYDGTNYITSYTSSSGVGATAGTQTHAGANGTGRMVDKNIKCGFGFAIRNDRSMNGAGNGYYAGGQGNHGENAVGVGSTGSCFISGYTGCNAISASSTGTNIIHTGQPNHYSGKVFTNMQMVDGAHTMSSPSGGTETGHTGDGVCIITQLSFN